MTNSEVPRAEPTSRRSVNHVAYLGIGLGVALLWTTVGVGIAAVQGTEREFIAQWYSLQGFPLIALGVWLLLIVRSGSFQERLEEVIRTGSFTAPAGWIRVTVVLGVGCAGTLSIASMGFNAHGTLRMFLWLACACVSFCAATVTAHAIDMLMSIRNLQEVDIKVYRYSPGRTPEIRNLVNYITSFSFLLTVGYGFALYGTMSPHWTGNKGFIDAVRVFWPALYVPACSVVLIYPHLVIHKLIRREKEQALLSCQAEIDTFLSRYETLTTEEVNRTNTLAQLFDRISATPNYVLDLGNALRTFLPLLFNVASLLAKFVVSPG